MCGCGERVLVGAEAQRVVGREAGRIVPSGRRDGEGGEAWLNFAMGVACGCAARSAVVAGWVG